MDKVTNQQSEKKSHFSQTLLQRFSYGIREKLIVIFIAIKVLPLIALAVFATKQMGILGDTFKDKSNEVVASTKKLVNETGTLATESSITALDLKSRESIERLTTDIADAVADFLYARDKDILQAADQGVNEESYSRFLALRTKELVSHQPWVLSEDGSRWQPKTANAEPPQVVEPGAPDNKRDFHYTPPYQKGQVKAQALYHEMTFVDLKGMERLKVSTSDLLDHGLRDVSRKENTWCKAETYFAELAKLKPGEIYVSQVIGEYVPSKLIGMYTPARARNAGIPFAPEQEGYAGKENPVGKQFKGIIRWATPVYKGQEKVGYVTLALDHAHIMEFTDHVMPTSERYSDIPDANAGNYAFMWDNLGRSITHPRHYFIVGYDRETGEEAVPWLSSELYEHWQAANGSFAEFEKNAPQFLEQTIAKRPVESLTKQGMLGLDCRYLNFAPQCIGWYNLTQYGGSGSFLIYWSNLWKLTTAAAIPYYTGNYGASPRGFGFVTIGANVDEFHSAANETAARIKTITQEYETSLETKRQDTLALIEQRLRRTISNLTVSTSIMVVLVILIAIWMAATLTGKITAIIKGLKRFQSGQLDERLATESRDELGELAKAFNEMSDKLQQSMADIRGAKERAEESDRVKGLFLANMSHEIRTPMNAILGMTHLALEGGDGEKRRKLLQTVESSAESLLRLLDDILDFSKMEAGQLRLNEKPFDLFRLLEGVRLTMGVPAGEKGLRLEVMDIPAPSACCFVGDELRLRQILLNLVNNAVKFTERGVVTLHVMVEDADSIEAKRVFVHFEVTDTGMGIPADKLPLIFNRFEQADQSYARQYGGAGLGLSICKQLVALMGGKIWAESKEGLGSSFHVVVPLEPSRAEELSVVPAHGDTKKRAVRGMCVLVVDDNEVNRDVAEMTLARDHSVVTAANGIEALKMLATGDFDVVLMDVQMPLMDGLSATREIRAAEEGRASSAALPERLVSELARKLGGRHLPVVAMTAHAMGGDQEMCLAAGMDAYITKPFHPGQLKEVLMRVMTDSNLPHESAPEPDMATGASELGTQPGRSMLEEVRIYLQTTTPLSPGQIEKILKSAVVSVQTNLASAEEALAKDDFAAFGMAIHTLKGTLLQCGLSDWAEKAQEMYSGIKADRVLPYAQLVASLRQGVAALWDDVH